MNKNYKYELQRGSKHTFCPNCNKKTFKLYVLTDDERVIAVASFDTIKSKKNNLKYNIMSKETVFKVGQKVFSARYGWGVVDSFIPNDAYPLAVYFNVEMNYKVKYKLDGLEDYNDKYPTLSFTNYIIDRFSQDPKDATYAQVEPDFDWGCLPAWANKYIAKDRDGSWCAYNEEPIKDVIDGMFDGSNYVDIPRKFKPTNGDDIEWENSILKNPNHD